MRKSFTTKQERATYQCWLDMKNRCFNTNSQRYYTHGKRGITVCDEWVNSYDVFLLEMGLKPDRYTLDRVDNDGDYCKDNCVWSTPKQQARNRRSNVKVTRHGVTMTVIEWAELVGISWDAMRKRICKTTENDRIDYPKLERKRSEVSKEACSN